MDSKIKYLYRYEMEHQGGVPSLFLVKLHIIGKTPCGIRVELKSGRTRWIGDTTRNRYAHNDERAALKGFIRRKTYRNHCIELETMRNLSVLIEANLLLKKHDKQGKEPTSKGSVKFNKAGRIS